MNVTLQQYYKSQRNAKLETETEIKRWTTEKVKQVIEDVKSMKFCKICHTRKTSTAKEETKYQRSMNTL